MSRCLVTGGAGFLGSHLVEALVEQDHDVLVLDNLSTGSLANLRRVEGRYRLIQGDVLDETVVCDAVQGVTYVYHLAAPVPGAAEKNPRAIHHVGSEGTLNVLLASMQARVKRLLYASSSAVYPPEQSSMTYKEEWVRPLTHYGVAKYAGELHCQSMFAMAGMETVRLRFFNIYGPRQNPRSPYARALLRVIDEMLLGCRPSFDATFGSQDLLYVDDAIHALLLSAQTPRAAGRVFNIASGRTTSFFELIVTLNRILEKRPLTGLTLADDGDGSPMPADISRAEIELGFCPLYSIERGLYEYVGYLRSQASLVKEIPCNEELVANGA